MEDNEFKAEEITLSARALLQMFGDDAPSKIDKRIAHYSATGSERGVKFWTDVKTEVVSLLRTPLIEQ